MQTKNKWLISPIIALLLVSSSCNDHKPKPTTVPFTLDHNRMLVEAEIQRKDGSWRKALLWVDSGNPDFFLSESLAEDLGIPLPAEEEKQKLRRIEVATPTGVRIANRLLNFEGVNTKVLFQPTWLFKTMHIDANLPSTVLKKYHIIFDYPNQQLSIAEHGSIKPQGIQTVAGIHPVTGIVQIDAQIGGQDFSFALDNGASYSFVSDKLLEQIILQNPKIAQTTGALGCANIWGWWPEEANWTVARIPEIKWGTVSLSQVGMVGLPPVFSEDGLGAWYSQKTARPVHGFLGPNAFKAFRIEIDYANQAVYFEKGNEFNPHDMDMVGFTLRLEDDGNYRIIGVAEKNGKTMVEGAQVNDLLIQIDDFKVKGTTMGSVVDALRGKQGDIRRLILQRNNKQFNMNARVERFP